MRIGFEIIGTLMFAYVIYLGLLVAWFKQQRKIADDRRELEEFRKAAEQKETKVE